MPSDSVIHTAETAQTSGPRAGQSVKVYIADSLSLMFAFSALYLSTASRHILNPDNGEIATLATIGGVAHPSGYPLNVLLLRAISSFMPGENPVHRAARATACVGAIAIGLVYIAARVWARRVEIPSPVTARNQRVSATFAAALLGISPLGWKLATHAEVFALNGLIAALLLIIAAPHTLKTRPLTRLGLLGLLAGLGLSNHVTIVLLLPVGIYASIHTLLAQPRRASGLAIALSGLVLGLSPYLYVIAVTRSPGTSFVWGEARDLSGLLFHFRRGEYGTTSFAVGPGQRAPLTHVSTLLLHVLRELLLIPTVIFIAKLSTEKIARRSEYALIASWLLSGPALVCLFNTTVNGTDQQVNERFYWLSTIVVSVFLTRGLADFLDRFKQPLFQSSWFRWSTCLTIIGISCAVSVTPVAEHHRPTIDYWARNTLRMAPPSAVILGTDDARFDSFLYLQSAERLRLDVVYIDVWLIHHHWYRTRMNHILGFDLPEPVGKSLSTTAIASTILASGRPLLLTNLFTDAIPREFSTYPLGTLIVVKPHGTPLPSPNDLENANNLAFAQFAIESNTPPPDSFGGLLHAEYARPWEGLANAFALAGDDTAATRCRTRAKLYRAAPIELR